MFVSRSKSTSIQNLRNDVFNSNEWLEYYRNNTSIYTIIVKFISIFLEYEVSSYDSSDDNNE